MRLPNSSNFSPNLIWREQSASTNTELIELVQRQPVDHFAVLATANQVAGRGRSGRSWQAPADSSLAISVLLKPQLSNGSDTSALGWLPLLAGLAMSQTVGSLLADSPQQHQVGVKWPNDVLVSERKISGVLSELVGVGSAGNGISAAVVVGAGVNLTLTTDELPVPTATSLTLLGANLPTDEAERFDLVLSGYLSRLQSWYGRFEQSGFDPESSGLREAVESECLSLGREVRAILPGGTEEVGFARRIDASGRLVLELSSGEMAISAGDIVHLRHK